MMIAAIQKHEASTHAHLAPPDATNANSLFVPLTAASFPDFSDAFREDVLPDLIAEAFIQLARGRDVSINGVWIKARWKDRPYGPIEIAAPSIARLRKVRSIGMTRPYLGWSVTIDEIIELTMTSRQDACALTRLAEQTIGLLETTPLVVRDVLKITAILKNRRGKPALRFDRRSIPRLFEIISNNDGLRSAEVVPLPQPRPAPKRPRPYVRRKPGEIDRSTWFSRTDVLRALLIPNPQRLDRIWDALPNDPSIRTLAREEYGRTRIFIHRSSLARVDALLKSFPEADADPVESGSVDSNASPIQP